MQSKTILHGALLIALASIGASSFAADKGSLGKQEYDSNCIACHGEDGKGGAYVDFLKATPPDLTLLAKKNGGVFPLERVYEVIDGRQQVKAHGSRDMPIWGKDYQIKAGQHFVDTPYDPEIYVRSRVLALIDYLNKMQAK